MQIQIPNAWSPRDYQIPVLKYFDGGGDRAATMWHRRAGKDACCLNFEAKSCFSRVAAYWHLMPTQRQARKAIWNGVNPKTGQKIIDQVFPKEIRKTTRQDEMMIELINGSIWQLCGSDNYDSLVGSNVAGVVFSEWSLTNPRAWDYIRPILAENGGWAWFNYTPRGKNHGYDLYQMAESNPRWFAQKLTVDDTGVISEDVIQDERDSGMPEDMIQQEYYCSFDGGIEGSYYNDLLKKAREEGRITKIPIEPTVPVNTFWDLGRNDTTAIWFHQQVGKEHRFIKSFENNGEGLQYYAQHLKDQGMIFGKHYLPHDVEVTELTTNKSRRQTLESLGVTPMVTVPRISEINEGIQMVRNMLPLCWFDEEGCKGGIRALESYHKEYDEKRQVFRSYPLHDWSSNYADAFRQFAQGYSESKKRKPLKCPKAYVA
ncbi:MAG: hypothetical protein ACN2B6_00015 [Rickettsiales bacterium]